MANVLVTGGAGFIGSYIVKELVELGHKPIILDLFAQYSSPTDKGHREARAKRFEGILDKVIIERGSVDHFGLLFEIIGRHKPEYIIHLAANPLTKMQNLRIEEGLGGPVISTSYILEIIHYLRETGELKDFKKFVYTSSSMVYGTFKSDIAKEDDGTEPINIYGTMKLAGEIITKGLCRIFKIPYNVVRTSAVYGPTDINKRVSQIFIDNAIAGKALTIHGGDDEKLDFSYVTDVAHGFVLATLSDVSGEIFNITGGEGRSLLEFANIIKKYYPNLKIEIKPRDQERPKRGTLSIEKAKRLLGYEPKYDIGKGIKEYIEFKKKNSR
jgi:UDP-glucose 4-epimerase